VGYGEDIGVGWKGHNVTKLAEGQRIRLPGEDRYVVVEVVQATFDDGLTVIVDDRGTLRKAALTSDQVAHVEALSEDGGAEPASVLAGLWAEWMRRASETAAATALVTTPLRPYPHQNRAVYGAMLPQPLLRFLLADEPGTGKTIMGGLWLREMQRLGFVRRALIVCPAHLVTKWQGDFELFLGGGLRRITADTIREEALSGEHDLWVVSLELAAVNRAVYDAIHPDQAGWDAVVFDEAHRLTPTAEQYHAVGRMLAVNTPRTVLMTATPHRGNEWLFRSIMHFVDPQVYPAVDRLDAEQPAQRLKPGPIHFLRRMKEELVDYDGVTRLFLERIAYNIPVPLNVDERAFYNDALGLVDRFFPAAAHGLAKMVYGKRSASALYSLAETLRRRRDGMGGNPADAARNADPYGDDEAERNLAEVVAEASTASREEKKAIGELLERIDAVLADDSYVPSKWPHLLRRLEPHGIVPGASEQVVVFTEFADTADWLVQRFTEAGFNAQRYSGRDPHHVRDQIRAKFASREFQVIVSTDAGNEGIDLQTAHVLVNWDIPWSLVRLEQRMGRIHRIGQTQVVELYNLIATGTREGDAHARLLDNLCAAANEMNGKMFDSLSLVGEIALAECGINDLERLLARTYETDDGSLLAIQAVRAITKERLRQVHYQQRAADEFLTSSIDLNRAVASLHEEALERINPHIVERFLARAAAAGLVSLTRSALADDGMWRLSPGSVRPLPGTLGRQTPALVSTSGVAKQVAVESGHAEAARAIALGPAEGAFRELVGACTDRLRPALWRGGHLVDQTAVTDYDLFLYETIAKEGGGRRTLTLSYLIRVDDTGARVVPWELLANLEAKEPLPKPPHPARVSQAVTQAAAELAADLARHKKALDEWLLDARNQLSHLPNELTDEIPDLEERKIARKRIERAVAERVAELESAAALLPGEPQKIGWAHITGAGIPADPTEKDSEQIAMRHITNLLTREDWHVSDVHVEGRGFDLYARRGRSQRCVEVKGVWDSASSRGVDLTGNELAKAGLLGEDYWLYVVDSCNDGYGSLYAGYPNPALVFADAAKDKAILHINGSALRAAKEALST
jgi:superfamily II DNA or RNA helicase